MSKERDPGEQIAERGPALLDLAARAEELAAMPLAKLRALAESGDAMAFVAYNKRPRDTIAEYGSHPRDIPHVAWEPSTHAKGLLYLGPWEEPNDGFNEHVRRCAEALASTGIPVHLRAIQPRIMGIDPAVEARMRPLAHASIHTYTGVVKQVVPSPGALTQLTTHHRLPPAYWAAVLKDTVISAVWERFPLPPEDVAALNKVGQVWVACSSNAELLLASGVTTPVRVIPIPHREDDPHLALQGKPRLRGPVRFYAIGKWEPRKGMKELIEAFLRAFRPGDAILTLKTSAGSPGWKTYPNGPAFVVAPLLNDPEVRQNGWTAQEVQKYVFVHQRTLPEQALLNLHQGHDVYVSLSRGEGFNMPAYDAALSGKLLVYVPSGGTEDFAGVDDIVVPVRGSVDADPAYGWPAGSQYLDYSLFDAVRALRLARERVMASSWRAADNLRPLRHLTTTVVGERMLAALRALNPTIGTDP